jgi:hypothetical protein
MSTRSDDEAPIEGRALTKWTVMRGGNDIGFELSTADGGTRSIVLPFDAMSSPLMTLPRMLQAALNVRCPDASLRVAQPLGKWRLEQAQGATGLLLKLSTSDGFEVAFALNDTLAGSPGGALVGTSCGARPDRPVSLN